MMVGGAEGRGWQGGQLTSTEASLQRLTAKKGGWLLVPRQLFYRKARGNVRAGRQGRRLCRNGHGCTGGQKPSQPMTPAWNCLAIRRIIDDAMVQACMRALKSVTKMTRAGWAVGHG